MTNINFKVIGLTQPWLETVRSAFEPVNFRFPNLSEQEAVALLIWPPQLVSGAYLTDLTHDMRYSHLIQILSYF